MTSCSCNSTLVPNAGCVASGNKCHEVVDTYAEVQQFRNAFVTVREEVATYHVDEIGNPIAVSRSAVFEDNFTPVAGAYKQNVVYDFLNSKFYVFGPDGDYKEGSLV